MTEGAATPEAQQPPARKRRWWLWLLLALILTPLLVVVASYGVLRSSLLHSHIWPRIQPMIAEQTGLEVQLRELRVDLLGQVQVAGIQIHQPASAGDLCEDLHLSLEKLELLFNPWGLLSGQLLIERLGVDHLDAQGCLLVKLPATSEPRSQAEPADPREALAEVLDVLENPPLAVRLDQLELKAVRADIQVQVPELAFNLHWAGQLDLDTSLLWNAEELSGQLSTQVHSSAPVQIQQSGEQQLKAQLKPEISSHLGWQLHRSNPWQLELQPLSVHLALSDLLFEVSSPDQHLTLSWPSYTFNLASGGHFNLQLTDDWPLNLDLLASSHLPLGQLQLEAEDFEVSSQFHHHLELQTQGQLALLKPNLEQLLLTVSSQQGLNQLQLLANQEPLSLEALRVQLSAANYDTKTSTRPQQEQLLLHADLTLEQLHTHPLLKAIDLYPSLHLKLHQDLSLAQIKSQLRLDDLELLSLGLEVHNLAEQLALYPQLQVQLPRSLQQILPEATELEVVGDLSLLLKGQAKWHHGEPQLLQADWSALPWGEVFSEWSLEVNQKAAPADGLQLTGPLKLDWSQLSQLDSGHHQLALTLNSAGVLHPPLLRALPINLELQLATDEQLEELTTQGQLRINHQNLMDWSLKLAQQPQQAVLSGEAHLQALPAWQQFIAEVSELDALGPLQLEQQLHLQLQHPWPNLLAINPETLDLTPLKLNAQLNTQLEQPHPPQNAAVHWVQPVRLQQQLQWMASAASVNAQLQLPEVRLADELKLQGLELKLQAQTNSGLEPSQAKLNLALQQQQVYLPDQLQIDDLHLQLDLLLDFLAEHLAANLALNLDAEEFQLQPPEEEHPVELTALVFPLGLTSQARANTQTETLNLDTLQLTLGAGWLTQQLSAESDFQGQRLLLEALTRIQLRDQLFAAFTGPMQASGELLLPWSLSLVDQEQLYLDAEADFRDLNLQLETAQLQGLQGRVGIQQQLQLINLETLRFSHLLQPDAFQRVDFSRVEPWLESRQDFEIQHLEAEGVGLGPLEATFNLEQNLIRLQDFSLGALGGEVAGQFYLDVNPAGWQLGLLSRATRIDLRQLLPDTLAATRYSPVNARTAVTFDFSRRLVEGRVDITDINRAQLLQLLDIIDPDHRDPQLATARSGLRAAHPRWVRVEMQNGLMDLTLQLSLFRDPIRVRNLPLSPLVERFAEEALLLPELIPLESAP